MKISANDNTKTDWGDRERRGTRRTKAEKRGHAAREDMKKGKRKK